MTLKDKAGWLPPKGPVVHSLGEVLTVSKDGAMRYNGAKTSMLLIPPETLASVVNPKYRLFIQWFHDPRCGKDLLGAALHLALNTGCGGQDIFGLAEVYNYGAHKYAPRNWELGLPFSNLYDSFARHAVKETYQELDEDETLRDGSVVKGSGLHHWKHCVWNIACTHAFVMRGRTDLDDRAAVLALPEAKNK